MPCPGHTSSKKLEWKLRFADFKPVSQLLSVAMWFDCQRPCSWKKQALFWFPALERPVRGPNPPDQPFWPGRLAPKHYARS